MVVSITIFEGLQAGDWTGITSIFLVLNYQIIWCTSTQELVLAPVTSCYVSTQ